MASVDPKPVFVGDKYKALPESTRAIEWKIERASKRPPTRVVMRGFTGGVDKRPQRNRVAGVDENVVPVRPLTGAYR